MSRTGAIIAVGEGAAAGDAELAALRDQAHQGTRDDVRALVGALRRAGALGDDSDDDHAADTIYALATDESVYLRLTRDNAPGAHSRDPRSTGRQPYPRRTTESQRHTACRSLPALQMPRHRGRLASCG